LGNWERTVITSSSSRDEMICPIRGCRLGEDARPKVSFDGVTEGGKRKKSREKGGQTKIRDLIREPC